MPEYGYDDLPGAEAVTPVSQPMQESADSYDMPDFNDPDLFRPDAFQTGDFDDEDLFKFDQPETMGDDRMNYGDQNSFGGQYDGFEDYDGSFDAYEPMGNQPAEPYFGEDEPQSGSEQPRSRRSRK